MEYTSDANAGPGHAPADTPLLSALFSDLVRCETRLYNVLNDRLRERHGIVTSQYEFLAYLRAHPGCRVADLAAEFAIGVGATSKGVDRLALQGWVLRRPNPGDRRSSLLDLTPAGTRLTEEAALTFTATLTPLLLPTLDPAALTATARALATLRAALEQTQTGTPAG